MDVIRTCWQHFDHEADIGVRGLGTTEAQAFEQAALAMSAAVTPLDHITPSQPVDIECDDEDLEVLLVDWLNAVIYELRNGHARDAVWTL